MDELGATEAVIGYGLSEASPNVAQSAWWEDAATRRAGRMVPQPGLELRVGPGYAEGCEGEIAVRGWSVMRGYLDAPEATAEVLRGGWLSTGDLGRVEDGRLVFLGRLKETLRVGGENVAPAEVEAVLADHPAVSFAAVVALPDARLGEVPVAFCVAPNGEAAAIAAFARERLAGFKAPRHVWCVATMDDLGLSAAGKVVRTDLSRRAAALLSETP